MRTTVNIADELLEEAKVLAARSQRSLGAVIDDALRLLLTRRTDGAQRVDWSFPTSGSGGLCEGVNLDDNEALAELLGDNVVP